jgi:hypothetical protein
MSDKANTTQITTRYIFAKNINNTFESGIVDVIDKVVLCYCEEWASHIILLSIESQKK